ncbi:hypothetical protein HMPREF1325_0151 [Treponema socranskii subsp. socranskii VPI DR56BR1116 = ATCC 35536]|uniref:Uncharacterized protein n=1 Tax=Treponema socranskii subsp. socranskii VPI DR56BR1116 = ATCC 35536 TaxID=1125725 RepID=U1GU78_TRESO|nr:hypothetical protein [Treponema socranskii]ERF60139.1 hypothetical protein HMPREF1325_0151 [Treponema socranskii subsp. socranskii VPI DR56BR1116 = ATCC 35536]
MSKIIFDTGLSESTFAKTRLSNLLSESGIAACADKNFGSDMTFSFSEWKFDGVKTIGDGDGAHVHLFGRFGEEEEMLSLAEIFLKAESGGNAERYEAAAASYAAVCAIEEAKKENVKIENIGAGGIYVKTAHGFADKPALLFLPQALFDKACATGGASYAKLQGFWISKALSERRGSLSFTQAVIAYRALAKRMPYDKSDESARSTDEYDKNYMKLEHVINGVDKSLAESVDAALELPSRTVEAERKNARGSHGVHGAADTPHTAEALHTADRQKENPFPLQAFYAELGIDDGTLKEVSHPAALPQAEFDAKVAAYYKSKKRSLRARRTFRRNAGTLAACFALAAVIAFFAFGAVRDARHRPSAVGLTSFEVAEAFYEAIHTQNVELVGAMSSGKVSKRYGDIVGSIYVVNKTRSAYDPKNGIVAPETWFASLSEENAEARRDVYGITSFTLDGRESSLEVRVPERSEKRTPVRSEGGAPLDDGTQAAHTAEYYTVRTDGETGEFIIERNCDTVRLTYKKNRWAVTGIEEKEENVSVDTAAFKSDAIRALQKYGGDAALASSALKEKYPWVPDRIVVQRAAERKPRINRTTN